MLGRGRDDTKAGVDEWYHPHVRVTTPGHGVTRHPGHVSVIHYVLDIIEVRCLIWPGGCKQIVLTLTRDA